MAEVERRSSWSKTGWPDHQRIRESSRHSSLNCPPWLMARLEVEDEKVPGQECQGVFRSERKALRGGMMVKAR